MTRKHLGTLPITKEIKTIALFERLQQYAFESEAYHRQRFGNIGGNKEIIEAIQRDQDTVGILIKSLRGR